MYLENNMHSIKNIYTLSIYLSTEIDTKENNKKAVEKKQARFTTDSQGALKFHRHKLPK